MIQAAAQRRRTLRSAPPLHNALQASWVRSAAHGNHCNDSLKQCYFCATSVLSLRTYENARNSARARYDRAVLLLLPSAGPESNFPGPVGFSMGHGAALPAGSAAEVTTKQEEQGAAAAGQAWAQPPRHAQAQQLCSSMGHYFWGALFGFATVLYANGVRHAILHCCYSGWRVRLTTFPALGLCPSCPNVCMLFTFFWPDLLTRVRAFCCQTGAPAQAAITYVCVALAAAGALRA